MRNLLGVSSFFLVSWNLSWPSWPWRPPPYAYALQHVCAQSRPVWPSLPSHSKKKIIRHHQSHAAQFVVAKKILPTREGKINIEHKLNDRLAGFLRWSLLTSLHHQPFLFSNLLEQTEMRAEIFHFAFRRSAQLSTWSAWGARVIWKKWVLFMCRKN